MIIRSSRFPALQSLPSISRLSVAAAFAAVVLAGCAALEHSPRSNHEAYPAISLYSPAAPPIILWSINEELGETLKACGAGEDVTTKALALPDSVNTIGEMPDRATHLPIVTTIDFFPAVTGTGTDWHRYARAHEDLKFVASLYEVGIGVMVFDDSIRTPADLKGKAIAVPRRPSSLRVTAEALLRDGWQVFDDVTLVDMPPQGVAQAAADGRIHATTWNMMVETPDGFLPLLPDLTEPGRWLPVTGADIDRINAKNDFVTSSVVIGDKTVAETKTATLLSFRQALAAWSSTSDAQVEAILQCLEATRGDGAEGATTLHDWPGLEEAVVHPAALEFYRQSNPGFPGKQDLDAPASTRKDR